MSTNKKATFVITHDFKTPYVRSTNDPRQPTEIKAKVFKKGEIISGVMQYANGKPTFVLFNGVCVVPLSVIRAVVTKEILSSASGPGNTDAPGSEDTRKKVIEKNPKIRFADAAIVGALVGLVGVYIANKKAWITVPNKNHYLIGAGVGAAAAMYLIYRRANSKKIKTQ